MEDGPNNFEQLLEQQSRAVRPELQQRTEEGLFKTFESLRLVGQLLDIFVPKMVNVLVAATGGDISSADETGDALNGDTKTPPVPPRPEGPTLPEGGANEIR